MLVDDVLLEIFDFYRNMHYFLRHWPPLPEGNWYTLVHVCRRWRKIIFDSPRRLNLRILCTHGSPVRKHLGIWPAFPIDLQLCSQSDVRPEDVDNAIAALEHRDRVNSVRLFARGPELVKIATAMQKPFPVLTCLYLRSWCEDTSVLTAAFAGPHLQEITLHRIPFPALPKLLLSTSDLVTLNLLDIPTPGYISPERMVACLVALPRLKVFAITFRDAVSHPDPIPPPPVTRPILPALTSLEFRGAFEYLEDFVAQIDSPQLEQISIIYLDQVDDFQVTLTQVSDFIDRLIGPELTSTKHAHVHFQFDRVTFTLSHDYETYQGLERRSVATTISHGLFGWLQVSDLARMLGQFSAALSTVVHLEFVAKLAECGYLDDAYRVEWLHLLRRFPVIQTLRVSLELAAPVSLALEDITAEMVTEVLPSLVLVCLEGMPATSLEKFVAIRQFSDHPITVVDTTEEFNERVESYYCR
jgi:hypothetical protein